LGCGAQGVESKDRNRYRLSVVAHREGERKGESQNEKESTQGPGFRPLHREGERNIGRECVSARGDGREHTVGRP